MKISKTHIIHETMKMEGQRFLIMRKMDKQTNLNEYLKLKKEADILTVRIDQFQKVLKAWK